MRAGVSDLSHGMISRFSKSFSCDSQDAFNARWLIISDTDLMCSVSKKRKKKQSFSLEKALLTPHRVLLWGYLKWLMKFWVVLTSWKALLVTFYYSMMTTEALCHKLGCTFADKTPTFTIHSRCKSVFYCYFECIFEREYFILFRHQVPLAPWLLVTTFASLWGIKQENKNKGRKG